MGLSANAHSIDDPALGPLHLLFMGHLQMPLRNDFATRSHPVPWRVSSNWGSDLFYCYYEEMFPRKEEYLCHTNRWQDFNPTLNQAELFLCETSDSDRLRVDIDTETPCFEAYQVEIDDGQVWTQTSTSMDWRLHAGLNRLRVKARNTLGRCGPESCAEVVLHT